LTVGDLITLDSPTGPVRLSIAGVFSSFRGAMLIDQSQFRQRWRDDRVDVLYVTVSPGVSPSTVRDALRAQLALEPTLISTRDEVVEQWDRALASLDVSIAVAVGVALAVAVGGSAASLLISAVERARSTAVLKAIGATPRQVGAASVVEALALALVSLGLAVPLGEGFSWLLRSRVADIVAGYRFAPMFPFSVLGWLSVALPIAAIVATWLPVRRIAVAGVADAIAHE
jgi:putative ABC transport system permease protein